MGSADSVALTEEFDPHDPAISADDLYARYDRLRAVCPITRHNPHGGYWLATGYDEVRRAAMDSKTFSSANGVYLPAVAEHRLPVLEMDDPEHRVWRKVLAPRFSTVAARGWQPRIRELIDELIDGFIERGRADLIHDFAEPLPLALIAEVFGLEPEQRTQVREDALKFLDNSTGDTQAKALLESMVARWVRLVEQRRREPAEDLITAVVQADFSPHAVSDVDIAWLMFALMLAWGAANRDPARFPDPNIAKFDRPNVRDHLTFGVGTHGCIGQFIARIELATAIELILERLGAYELDGIARRNGLTGGGHHHGVEYLPVRFTAGPRRGSSE